MSAEIVEKLDVLIRLQAAALTSSLESSKEKIIFLAKAGLKPALIAEIVGTSANHVSVTLSKERSLGRTKS
jgi:hypothetical protein